jgi:hypothetical protein
MLYVSTMKNGPQTCGVMDVSLDKKRDATKLLPVTAPNICLNSSQLNTFICETVFVLPYWTGYRIWSAPLVKKYKTRVQKNFAAHVQCGREKFHGEFQLDRADPARTANGLTELKNTIKQGPN